MFTITTTYRTDDSGKGKVTAKGHGKQRTVSYDPARSVDANHGLALGALLDVLTDDRQQAMLRHPSARQRVTTEGTMTGAKWSVNV